MLGVLANRGEFQELAGVSCSGGTDAVLTVTASDPRGSGLEAAYGGWPCSDSAWTFAACTSHGLRKGDLYNDAPAG